MVIGIVLLLSWNFNHKLTTQ